ncbi:hypothetical protein ACTA71_004156 [Dictyostelium dimigraforme]
MYFFRSPSIYSVTINKEMICQVKTVRLGDANTAKNVDLEFHAAVVPDLKDGCEDMKSWMIHPEEGHVTGQIMFKICYRVPSIGQSELKTKELIDTDHLQDNVYLIQMEGFKNDDDLEDAIKSEPIVQEDQNKFGAFDGICSIIKNGYPEMISAGSRLPPLGPELYMKIQRKDQIIKPLNSLTSFPIVAVAKPDVSPRMCADAVFRQHLKQTYLVAYIDDFLVKTNGTRKDQKVCMVFLGESF